MTSPVRTFFRSVKWLLLALAGIVLVALLWGGDFLISVDPRPSRVDGAVVLQGSIVAEKTRVAGAIDLLRTGVADRIMLIVPKESYWGQSIPPVARAYLERTYGAELAARVDFCEASAEVNSSAQEAEIALRCVQEHHWRSIVVVTSDYHTRRTRILWRRAQRHSNLALELSVVSVADPEFQAPWWRHRQSAKIWLGESLKLAWTALGG